MKNLGIFLIMAGCGIVIYGGVKYYHIKSTNHEFISQETEKIKCIGNCPPEFDMSGNSYEINMARNTVRVYVESHMCADVQTRAYIPRAQNHCNIAFRMFERNLPKDFYKKLADFQNGRSHYNPYPILDKARIDTLVQQRRM